VPDAYLVDSGVFIRWFVPQDGYQHALEVQAALLGDALRLETVDLARFEVADVLRRKGLLAGILDRSRYTTAVRVVDDLGVTIHSTDVDAVVRAADLAARRAIRFYDAVFVDRALEQQLPLLTADAKLCRAVDGLLSTELLRGVAGT